MWFELADIPSQCNGKRPDDQSEKRSQDVLSGLRLNLGWPGFAADRRFGALKNNRASPTTDEARFCCLFNETQTALGCSR